MEARKPYAAASWRTWASIAAAVVALGIKTTIALTTDGSNDAMTWESDLVKVQNQGAATLYREGIPYVSSSGIVYSTQAFIHPPFMLTALRAWAVLERISGLPLRFWLRFTSSVADLLSLFLAAKLLQALPRHTSGLSELMAMALCPVSLVISGFHGNTDPVMIAFVLLSIYLIVSGQPLWAAGAAMGMALNIKIVPVIFVPAVLLYLPAMRERIRYLASLGGVLLLGSLPYLLHDPLLIAKTILSYTSKPGLWGFSLLSVLSRGGQWSWLFQQYDRTGKFLVLTAVLLLSIAMNFRKDKPPLFLQCGAITFLFLFLTPGFAMQYLAWLVPWVLALGLWPTLAFYGVSGIFVVLVYNDWCGGFPWYVANVLLRPWEVRHALLGLCCWLTVTAILAIYFHQLFATKSKPNNLLM